MLIRPVQICGTNIQSFPLIATAPKALYILQGKALAIL